MSENITLIKRSSSRGGESVFEVRQIFLLKIVL